ncbi:hypothetical protein MLD38_006319 [Melastoma candidum]|uniref:Uncharacterized protein n=1 Tax=Melastoma candidum TaxID=119954 RepID=A0ACB9RNS4_9MYRT|nr:hypothetical protein MLD38_006319 [Melastoma candidum]
MSLSLKAGTRPPWVGLGAAVWVEIASGNPYNFPLFSHSLKSVLRINQHQLTMLGVAIDIGENFGILPGVICNKFPPWVVLLIGSLACLVGYGVIWLSLSRTVENLPYWLIWLSLCIASNSSTWFNTAVLVTNMRNFPTNRGMVAGILKSYGGISAAVFTEVYSTLLRHSSTNLLLFLSIGIPLLCISMMYFVRPCVPGSIETSAEYSHFTFIQATSFALGLYVLSTTIMNDLFPFSPQLLYSIVVVMVLLLLAPLIIPVKMTIYRIKTVKPTPQEPQVISEEEISEPLLTKSTSVGNLSERNDSAEVNFLLAEGEGAVKKMRRPRRGEDFNFSEALVKADFWLLFFAYFIGVGTGVTVLNNLAQIGIAIGVHDTTILLSIFSFGNFIGRLGGGAVSEHYVREKLMPRTIWMTFSHLIMIISYLLFASASTSVLYAATATLGVCYGVQFTIMVPTVSELFGLKHFGLFYNFMLLGNPIGAFLFSGVLAGYIYDNEAAKQHGWSLVGSSITCLGPSCFRLTFQILAAVSALGVIMSIILTTRIRPVYQALYAGTSFRSSPSTSH